MAGETGRSLVQLYRMHDANPTGAIPCSRDEARRFNTPEFGFGVFVAVNEFDGARRKENLRKITAWAVDMDTGTKAQQHKRLESSPLVPSMIVETKRGFQAWWIAKPDPEFGPARAEHWNALVLERLVPYFGADKNARDLCRILRAPGFLHLKDPADPFKCRTAWRLDVSYTERQLASHFPWVPNKAEHDRQRQEAQRDAQRRADTAARECAAALGSAPSQSLWDAIYQLDQQEALARLSGHWAVSGEQYSFRPAPRGHANIYVNGKSSSCFVDEHRRIGSLAGGGPTIVQWLRWFKHDWKTVLSVVKELFPQLPDERQRP